MKQKISRQDINTKLIANCCLLHSTCFHVTLAFIFSSQDTSPFWTTCKINLLIEKATPHNQHPMAFYNVLFWPMGLINWVNPIINMTELGSIIECISTCTPKVSKIIICLYTSSGTQTLQKKVEFSCNTYKNLFIVCSNNFHDIFADR